MPNRSTGCRPVAYLALIYKRMGYEDGGDSDGEDGEEDSEDEYEGGEEDDEDDDDTAEPGTMATYVGNAVAPAGYKILEECPPMTTDAEMSALIGKQGLFGWDNTVASGWYLGKIQGRGLSATDLRKTPTANFVVRYTKAQTGSIHGNVACELSPRLYGAAVWWVLVERV